MWKSTKNNGNAILEKRSTCDGRINKHLFNVTGSSSVCEISGMSILIRLPLWLFVDVANKAAVAAAVVVCVGEGWRRGLDWSCIPF